MDYFGEVIFCVVTHLVSHYTFVQPKMSLLTTKLYGFIIWFGPVSYSPVCAA